MLNHRHLNISIVSDVFCLLLEIACADYFSGKGENIATDTRAEIIEQILFGVQPERWLMFLTVWGEISPFVSTFRRRSMPQPLKKFSDRDSFQFGYIYS